MVEPSRRLSRLVIGAGTASAVVLLVSGFVLGRTTTSSPSPIEAAPLPAPPLEKEAPRLPVSPPLLGRADLIAAAAAAADSLASASGAPVVRDLKGRRFELRLPFGCGSPAAATDESPLRWQYDEASGTLRLQARPERWIPQEWVGNGAAQPIEAIEGFWISRPWSSSEECPRLRAGPGPAASMQAPREETLGIAEFSLAGSSRLTRRNGDPYQAVAKVAPDALNASLGFRLRLQGRVTTVPDGRSILCRAPAGPERRPVCLIAVSIDTVSFLNPATGDTLATWDVSSEPGPQPASR